MIHGYHSTYSNAEELYYQHHDMYQHHYMYQHHDMDRRAEHYTKLRESTPSPLRNIQQRRWYETGTDDRPCTTEDYSVYERDPMARNAPGEPTPSALRNIQQIRWYETGANRGPCTTEDYIACEQDPVYLSHPQAFDGKCRSDRPVSRQASCAVKVQRETDDFKRWPNFSAAPFAAKVNRRVPRNLIRQPSSGELGNERRQTDDYNRRPNISAAPFAAKVNRRVPRNRIREPSSGELCNERRQNDDYNRRPNISAAPFAAKVNRRVPREWIRQPSTGELVNKRRETGDRHNYHDSDLLPKTFSNGKHPTTSGSERHTASDSGDKSERVIRGRSEEPKRAPKTLEASPEFSGSRRGRQGKRQRATSVSSRVSSRGSSREKNERVSRGRSEEPERAPKTLEASPEFPGSSRGRQGKRQCATRVSSSVSSRGSREKNERVTRGRSEEPERAPKTLDASPEFPGSRRGRQGKRHRTTSISGDENECVNRRRREEPEPAPKALGASPEVPGSRRRSKGGVDSSVSPAKVGICDNKVASPHSQGKPRSRKSSTGTHSEREAKDTVCNETDCKPKESLAEDHVENTSVETSNEQRDCLLILKSSYRKRCWMSNRQGNTDVDDSIYTSPVSQPVSDTTVRTGTVECNSGDESDSSSSSSGMSSRSGGSSDSDISAPESEYEISNNVPECIADPEIVSAAPEHRSTDEKDVSVTYVTEILTSFRSDTQEELAAAIDTTRSDNQEELATAISTIACDAYEFTLSPLEEMFIAMDSANTPVSEPHSTEPNRNAESCPDHPFAAATEPVPIIIPTPSSIYNVSQRTEMYPDDGTLHLTNACEHICQNPQLKQPLESQQSQADQEHQRQVPTPPEQPLSVSPPQQPVFLQPQQSPPPVRKQPQPVTSLQPQKSLSPAPPQSEVAVTHQELNPDLTGEHLDSQGATVTSIDMLLAVVKQSILCSNCQKTFNRTFVCHDYLIQLNRPIQCPCGCVKCTRCYREQGGCRAHNVLSKRAAVNTTASTLAGCPDLENTEHWDLELEIGDHFKTDKDVNGYVQQIMNEERNPDFEKLQTAFNHLISAGDSVSFKYWVQEPMPEEVAYRYVCIPHVPGFWDHILVGTRPPPKTEKMIGHDDYLPKLFNVLLGSYRFHWCCFVLKKQIILAMWCTSVPGKGQANVFPLVDNDLRNLTTSISFRTMVVYLSTWFTAQYVSPADRRLKVVLDCKPSEGSTLVHVIALLASKCGMEEATPRLRQRRAKDDTKYNFNTSYADAIFAWPIDTGGNCVNIVDEFNWRTSESNGPNSEVYDIC